MATLCGRTVFGDMTNVAKDLQDCAPGGTKDASSGSGSLKVTKKRKSALVGGKLSEKMQDMLDDQAASDEVLASMRSNEANALWRAGMLVQTADKGSSETLPRADPSRNFAAWMFGHLVEHVGLPEPKWLDAMHIFDIYCLHRPEVPESASLPTVCTTITRLVKKFDTQNPEECIGTLPCKASSLAQWLQRSACPHFDAWVTLEDVNQYEDDILGALGWNIMLPTVQDWMIVLCARLNVFTCNGLKHLLTLVTQNSFLHARVLATHCPTNTAAGSHRVAQGLLCLNLICAHVLPAETFGITELATPPWGGAATGQPQCRQESLEFLLDGLEDATGSDIATLQADTHMVNETLLILRASN